MKKDLTLVLACLLAAAVLTQLGDTLATIAAQRERCGPGEPEI